jgi:hypothetical protein
MDETKILRHENPGFVSRLRRFLPAVARKSTRAPRQVIPNLGASYWTGGAPQVFTIGNISASGFYIVTDRLCPSGTMLLMTLQRTNISGNDPRDSISVLVQAVRYGSDGMGFEFVTEDFVRANPRLGLTGKGTNREVLKLFLLWMKLLQED